MQVLVCILAFSITTYLTWSWLYKDLKNDLVEEPDSWPRKFEELRGAGFIIAAFSGLMGVLFVFGIIDLFVPTLYESMSTLFAWLI